MSNGNERELALGKRGVYKAELKRTLVRAGIYMEDLHELTNPVLGQDFMDIDMVKATVLIQDLHLLQKKAKAAAEKIDQIDKIYHFEDEGI